MRNFENMTTPHLRITLEQKVDFLATYGMYLPETDRGELMDEIREIRTILACRKA